MMGVIFAIYRTFQVPDEEAKLRIAVLDVMVGESNRKIDKILINDLPHIDVRLQAIHEAHSKHDILVAEKFAQLFTIIEERLPRKL